MALDTVFGVAPLTRVAATLPVALALVREGIVALADPVDRYVPAFTGAGKTDVAMARLLPHMSGLRSLHGLGRTGSGRELAAAALATALTTRAGRESDYGDLHFFVLGELLARALEQPLDQTARDPVFAPLGVAETSYLPAPDLAGRAAATEATPGADAPKVGVVHDESMHAIAGVAGHAGRFTTAADLGRYLGAWVGAGPPDLSPALRQRALRPSTPPPKRRGWGGILQGDGMAPMGDLWPQGAAGHTGLTGPSLAFDRARGLWVVPPIGRVHFDRSVGLRSFRARLRNAAAAAPL